MKRKTLIVYWCVAPLLIAAYIAAMASASAKPHAGAGPNDYAAPNGNAWGLNHGKGKPDKTP